MTPSLTVDMKELASYPYVLSRMDMMEQRKKHLTKELDKFDKMDEFNRYMTILSEIGVLSDLVSYQDKDIKELIGHVKTGFILVILLNIIAILVYIFL